MGPEEIPYGSLGACADALSTTLDLSDWQTRQLLIHRIPTEDIPLLSQKVYTDTNKLSNNPASSGYHGALRSIKWADTIDEDYRLQARAAGVLGAGIGGTVGIVGNSIPFHDYMTFSTTTTPEDVSFASVASATAFMIGPALALGAIGAYVAKKYTPKLMKLTASPVARAVKASAYHTDTEIPEGKDLVATVPLKRKKPYQGAIPKDHPENIEEPSLYNTAKKWANHAGCTDEQKYADFLLADMQPGEVIALVGRTKERFAKTMADNADLKNPDLRYATLLQDMQMARMVTTRRDEVQSMLKKVSRGATYAGTLAVVSGVATSGLVEAETATSPPSYGATLLMMALYTALAAGYGGFMSYAASGKIDPMTQRRARRVVEQATQ